MLRVLPLLLASTVALAGKPLPAAIAAAPTSEVDTRAWRPYFSDGPGAAAKALFLKEDWAAAARAFGELLQAPTKRVRSRPSLADDARLAARFLEAYALSRAGQFDGAAARFDELVSAIPLLAGHARLYAARAFLAVHDWGAALERARLIDAHSTLDAEARLVRAEALRQLGRLAESEQELRGYLDGYPGSWREAEVRFRLGETLEQRARDDKIDRAAEAKAAYRQVYVRFPTESWAKSARERLVALADPVTLRGPEHVTRGMALFDQMRNRDSEAEFRAALQAGDLDPAQQCVAAYHLAQSVFKARERPRAGPLFDQAEALCARVPNGKDTPAADLHAKALYQGARCHAARQEYAAALARFERIEVEHPSHSYADDARLRQAEILDGLIDRLGGRALLVPPSRAPRPPATPLRLALADEQQLLGEALAGPSVELAAKVRRLRERVAALYSTIPSRYASGDQGGEALFRLAFDAFRRGALDEARKWLEQELATFPREEGWWEAGRTLYWLGRVAEAGQKPDEARAHWARAAREYPLSFYALLALNRLRERAPDEAQKLIAALRTPAPSPADLVWHFVENPVFSSAAFRRGVELARMGLGAEARRELGAAGIRVPDRRGPRPQGDAAEALLWAAAVLYDRAGEWALSHAIPRYVLTEYARTWPVADNARRWRLSFPRGYEALVVDNAQKNGQPVALQFAIIREESAWNPSDESFANAIGLTQLTLAPAKRFAQGLPYTREALRDPVINVTIGARELGDVWKKSGGRAPLAIASYNAGEGAVRRWLRNADAAMQMDEFIESIPYDETRGYTKRVLGSYFAYHWLYEGGDPVPPLPQALPDKL